MSTLDFSNKFLSYAQQYEDLLNSLDSGIQQKGEEDAWSTSAPVVQEMEQPTKSKKRGFTEPKIQKTNWTEKEIWKKYIKNYIDNKNELEYYFDKIFKTVRGVNPITFTLSPQSTPGFRRLTLEGQYERFKLFFKTMRELYQLEFVVFFELYPMSPGDMHCHGFIKTASAKKLTELRQEWKRWHKNCKPNDHRYKDHSQKFEIAHDSESVERWAYYCLKDQTQMIQLGYPPIYIVQS